MINRFETNDGLKLAFRDQGEGLPLLCLSGLTRNSSDFDYLAPHLTDIRLIRLDYRGRGKSDWADPSTYTVLVEAQDALALLDHLGLESVAILGTSRGGLIAMTLAAIEKHRLRGVCLNDIGPVVDETGLDQIRGYVGKNPPYLPLSELAAMRAGLMDGFANVPDTRWLEEVRKHFVETDDGITINYDPNLARIFDGPSDGAPPVTPDLWSLFDAMQGLPLALLRGANSDILSAETATEMQRRRPDMIYREIPDRGHVPFLDEPDSLNTIHQWLTGIT